MRDRLIKYLIVKYFEKRFRKHQNTVFTYKNFVVRMFSTNYYNRVMQNHNAMEAKIINPSMQIKVDCETEKGGADNEQ